MMTGNYPVLVEPDIEVDEVLHRYRDRETGAELVSVTDVLAANGFYDDLNALPEQLMTAAKTRGQLVHRATHLDDMVGLDLATVSAECQPFVSAWQRFRAAWGFTALYSEWLCHSAKHRLAGRADRIGVLWGATLCYVDLKCGASPGVKYQLAAYRHMVGLPGLRVCVRLNSDATFDADPFAETEQRAHWNDFLTLYRAMQIRDAEGIWRGKRA